MAQEQSARHQDPDASHIVINWRDGGLDEFSACGLPRAELGAESMDGPVCDNCMTAIMAMRHSRGLS